MPIETEVRLVGRPLQAAVEAVRAESVAVSVRPGPDGPAVGATGAEVSTGIDVAQVLAREDAKGEAGELIDIPAMAGQVAGDRAVRILLVGVGDGTPRSLRKAGAALARRVRGRGAVVAGLDGTLDGADGSPPHRELGAFAEGLLLGSYTFTRRSRPPNRGPAGAVDLIVDDPGSARAAIDRASVTARAVALARDLVNTPATEKSPDWLSRQAIAAGEASGVGARVRGDEELRAEGFGGILAVGMGSPRPPRLIELSYPGDSADPSRPHVVLVGKGITFDSGGLSLKPNDNMKLMKTDMAGGAAVIAAMSALRDRGVRARVTGLVAAAENMPSGSAQRPGDVITHYGGRTVEVLNTDAEGRLVLADALVYADRVLHPSVVVDLATLTGAVRVALGQTHAGMYTDDAALAEELTAAGEASGDRVWRMPLVDDYRDTLDSDVADLANIERKNYGAGSVVAALFLREFAGSRPWAHLDIAGAARATSDEYEITKGGTGFGVRILLDWLADG